MQHPMSHPFNKPFYIELSYGDLKGHVISITRSDGCKFYSGHGTSEDTIQIQDMKQFEVRFHEIHIRDGVELEMLRQCILESYVENIIVDVRGRRGYGHSSFNTSKDKIATNLEAYIHIGDECSFNIACDIVAWNYDKLNKPLGG